MSHRFLVMFQPLTSRVNRHMTSRPPRLPDLGPVAERCRRLLLGVSVAFLLASSPISAQELRYEIRLNSAASGQTLAFKVSGSGFRAAQAPLDAHLPNWGDWADLGRPYIQNITVNNRPASPNMVGTIPLGTGSFVLRYELPVLDDTSPDAHRFPHLPRGGPGTAVAAVFNTLVVIKRGGVPVAARASIRLTAPRTGGTFTGWAGFAEGAQSARVLPVAEGENGFYAFGVLGPALHTANGIRLEVVSAVGGAWRVNDITALASRTLPVLQRTTGVAPDSVVRIIVQRSGLPGVTRGTTTRFGIAVALPPDDTLNEASRSVVVHEFTHLWIGRRFPDERLIWFMEGFTDYLALWTAAAAGVVTPDWFAQRLAAIADEVAALPPAPARPLSAQAVRRDSDGSAERLAYRGGALAAFSLDVALRGADKGTLGSFIGKLLKTPDSVLTERAIRASAEAMGAGAEFRTAVDSVPLTSPWPALRSVGFVISEEPASLVALGIAAEADGRQSHLTKGPAIVRAVDPNGPSAAADIVPGDTVIIRTARRQNPPTHDVAITSVSLGAYTFGSSIVPSGSRTVTLEVRRSGATRTVEVTPRLVQGGLRLSAKWEPSRASRFFTVVAPRASKVPALPAALRIPLMGASDPRKDGLAIGY